MVNLTKNKYSVVVKKPIEFMNAVISALMGNSFISIEGKLNKYDFSTLKMLSNKETKNLKRHTLQPREDFIVLPLDVHTKEFLVENLFHRIGLRKNVSHIQIEKDQELVFGAYDWFHEECVWITTAIGESTLEVLLKNKIILKYNFRPPDSSDLKMIPKSRFQKR